MLCEKIASRDYTIGIMGLGYVGLPLALVSAKAGFKVIGFDTDATRVNQLNNGVGTIKHISNAAIATAIEGGLFKATNDFTELAKPDAILIAVPTPLSRNREPDLSFVERSTESIAAQLRPGQLVVLESTTWPGTTAGGVEAAT